MPAAAAAATAAVSFQCCQPPRISRVSAAVAPPPPAARSRDPSSRRRFQTVVEYQNRRNIRTNNAYRRRVRRERLTPYTIQRNDRLSVSSYLDSYEIAYPMGIIPGRQLSYYPRTNAPDRRIDTLSTNTERKNFRLPRGGRSRCGHSIFQWTCYL